MKQRTVKAKKVVGGRTLTKYFSQRELDTLGKKSDGTYDGWTLLNGDEKPVNDKGIKPKAKQLEPEPESNDETDNDLSESEEDLIETEEESTEDSESKETKPLTGKASRSSNKK